MNDMSVPPKPMEADQLEYVKKMINRTYLFLISHTEYDPKVVEIMKLAALADVQKGMKPESAGKFSNFPDPCEIKRCRTKNA